MESGETASAERIPGGTQEQVQRQSGPDDQVSARGGAVAVVPDKHHEKAEAHQEHGQNVDGEIILFDLPQTAFGKLARRLRGKRRDRGQKQENRNTQGQFCFHGNFASDNNFIFQPVAGFRRSRESLGLAVSGVKRRFL